MATFYLFLFFFFSSFPFYFFFLLFYYTTTTLFPVCTVRATKKNNSRSGNRLPNRSSRSRSRSRSRAVVCLYFLFTRTRRNISLSSASSSSASLAKQKTQFRKTYPSRFSVCVCDLRVETADWRVFDGGTRLILTGSDVDVFPWFCKWNENLTNSNNNNSSTSSSDSWMCTATSIAESEKTSQELFFLLWERSRAKCC